MAAFIDFEGRGGTPGMNNFLGHPISPEGDDSSQGDITMLESPDSGYRSPQNYFSHRGGESHVVLVTQDEPYLELCEEPVEKFRFRYKSEMAGTHGSLSGVNSDRSRKQTFPTVALRNYSGRAIIRCSLYQHNSDYDDKPHAHRLVKKIGNDEVDDPHDIEVTEEDGYVATFQNMGIIHTAKKFLISELTKKKRRLKIEEIKRLERAERKLTKKEEYEIEMAANSESKSINLNIVRLRFDAFTHSQCGALVPVCPPVYSHWINNLKSALTGELKIVRMSRCSSTCKGGAEVFLLVEKVTKKNIEVRFFEEDVNGIERWEAYGKFSEVDVHHQYAIVLKTPPYKDLFIKNDVKVFIELVRKSDNSRSDPKEFTYTPSSTIKIGAKRARMEDNNSSFSSLRSCNSANIPTTIISDLSSNFEKQSLDLENDLHIDTEELEKCYHLLFSGECGDSENPVDLDGPRPKNKLLDDSLKENLKKKSLSDKELQYCNRAYVELRTLRKTNPGERRAVEFLVEYFKNQVGEVPTYNNPLHIAVCNYNRNTRQCFDFFLAEIRQLKQTDFLDLVNYEKKTPLHLAVSLNFKEATEKLILAKANVNCKDIEGSTALHLAVKNNNQTILETIFRYGSDIAVDAENNDGDTPLNIAIRKGHYACFVLLCNNKANVNKRHKKDGFTPLRMAIERADVKMVRFLLQSMNVDVTIGDFGGNLPITAAEILKKIDSVETRQIFTLLEEYMVKAKSGIIKPEYPIKEEAESESEADEELHQVEIKREGGMDELKKLYEKAKELSPDWEELCQELDGSGGWQYLAELLDFKHFLDETVIFRNEPSKTLLRLALNKGESLFQIREFLDNLDENRAIEIMDRMVYKQME